MQVVVFELNQEKYAFDIKDVLEIVRVQKTTKLPDTPDYLEGVINLRGKIIPVLNLAQKFNLKMSEEDDATRLIVLNLANNKHLAVKVGEVTEVLNIDEKDIDEVPETTMENNKEHCVTGIAKLTDQLIILLDTNKIIKAEQININ